MTPAESLSTPDNQPHGQVDATLSFAGFSAPISVVAVESGGLSPGVDQKSGTNSDTVMKAQTMTPKLQDLINSMHPPNRHRTLKSSKTRENMTWR